MLHEAAVKLAEIINKDFARTKCAGYLASPSKEQKDDLEITDDWFVRVSEKK